MDILSTGFAAGVSEISFCCTCGLMLECMCEHSSLSDSYAGRALLMRVAITGVNSSGEHLVREASVWSDEQNAREHFTLTKGWLFNGIQPVCFQTGL